MESTASSSSPPPDHHHHHRIFSDRLLRAVQHRLRLLHRSGDSTFFILGATGNVYTVTISATPTCTCPDRAARCKHVFFVLIRVLGLSPEDPCLWRRTLRPCQVRRFLRTPSSDETLAGAALRERFHLLHHRRSNGGARRRAEAEAAEGGGGACPVCLEMMGGDDEDKVVVACGTCKNAIHEECFLAWKRSSRRRVATCVLCRSKWRSNGGDRGQEKYLNLLAYVGDDYEDDNVAMMDGGDRSRCG